MKPSKLKRYPEKVYPNYTDKNVNFFKGKENSEKHQHLDSTGEFQQHSRIIVEASYVIGFIIAKQCKPYAIGETLIKSCASEMARIVLGKKSKMKFQQIPLSNNSIQRRIADLSDNIKKQVIAEIKNSQLGLFSIQIDETTDVVFCFQLLVFCRYLLEKL